MTTVTLIKGHKGQQVWSDKTMLRAEQRADALAELHNVSQVTVSDSGGLVVDASQFYDGRRK